MQKQGEALDTQLAQKNQADYAPGGSAYEDIASTQGTQAADAAYQQVLKDEANGSYANEMAQYASNDPNAVDTSSTNAPGFGTVIHDLILLATVGFVLWLFFSVGGAREVQRLGQKGKAWTWAVLAGAALLAWYVYSKIEKTATDAQTATSNLGTGIWEGLKTINPFA